jgi:hypothetical protein
MTLDPELFPALNQVTPAGGYAASVPAGVDVNITAGSINDYDARLIVDLVANIRFQADVLKQYGLTDKQLAAKMLNPGFAAHFRATQAAWNSDMNAQERIRLKAAFILEDSLPDLGRIVKNPQTPVNAKLAAIESLTKISTVANVPKQADGGGGEKHSITINIGGGREPVTINAETTK